MTTANAGREPTLMKLSDTDREIVNPEEDVRNKTVIDVDGSKLGKVTDLLVDDGGNHVRFMLVEHGGILGFGATESYIPVDTITEVTVDEVRVNTNLEKVAGIPEYDPDIETKPGLYENTYGYYGVTPFWDSGYVEPGFPYFGHRG
ncbi:MAG: PRC-barrel domain-containing protein [Nakamurella sp.]